MGLEGGDLGDNARLLASILGEHRRHAERGDLAPVEGDEALGKFGEFDPERAVCGGGLLDAQLGEGEEEGVLVTRNKEGDEKG